MGVEREMGIRVWRLASSVWAEAKGGCHGPGLQPCLGFGSDTWGVAPGWDGGAPLALKSGAEGKSRRKEWAEAAFFIKRWHGL